MDRRHYSPRTIRGTLPPDERQRGLPQVYRGRGRKSLRDIMDRDHNDHHGSAPFRWLLSTCLAGVVGAVSILVVINGSSEDKNNNDGLIPALRRLQEGALLPPVLPKHPQVRAGLNWAAPKTDLLKISTGTTSTRYIIHDALKQKRDGRFYIRAKPYVRIVARLAPVPKDYADVIPPFNPFKLYADSKPVGAKDHDGDLVDENANMNVEVVELIGGILPEEDGQELNASEVQEIVEKAQIEESFAAGISNLSNAIGGDPLALEGLENANSDLLETSALPPPNTTLLVKSVIEADVDADDLEGAKKVIVAVGDNDTLKALLIRNGSLEWQAEAMVEAASKIIAEPKINVGDEVHITLVPSAQREGKMEPTRFSLFGFGQQHRVTVARDEAGDFQASDKPITASGSNKIVLDEKEGGASSTLYASIYYACLLQNVPPETILKLMKVLAYTTDFRRRVSAGDTLEMFFDFNDKDVSNGPPGELMLVHLTSRGETSRFYRYRTKDQEVDFYDAKGNNSKKFLMRKPVRGSGVRLTSGFGMRHHPVLNRRRMHTGVDWAARPGTPILAAGRGTIVYAGRKGAYGNYVRIKHANGYNTAYAHMKRFGRGVKVGAKVRQGQVIGYVGTTGLSSGPHLHFEVLVNKRFVNPMRLKESRERQLTENELIDFRLEKARVDELIHRAPVMTSSK